MTMIALTMSDTGSGKIALKGIILRVIPRIGASLTQSKLNKRQLKDAESTPSTKPASARQAVITKIHQEVIRRRKAPDTTS
jgi:hypothetical protein